MKIPLVILIALVMVLILYHEALIIQFNEFLNQKALKRTFTTKEMFFFALKVEKCYSETAAVFFWSCTDLVKWACVH